MDASKFTKKTLEATINAQNLARENANQQIAPEHLAFVLISDREGLIRSLLEKTGADTEALEKELLNLIKKLPKVMVSGGVRDNLYLDRQTERIYSLAEEKAKEQKDLYIGVEHLFSALLDLAEGALSGALKKAGVSKKAFLEEVNKVRNGPITTDNPEDTYEALEKFGTDITKRAKENKLDPVIGRDRKSTRLNSSH